MKKNKRKIFIVLFLSLILLGIYFIPKYFNLKNSKIIEDIKVSNQQEEENKKNSETKIEITQLKKINSEIVYFSVLGKKYNIQINEGDTVYDVMNNIQKENNFSFKYKEYPSLGIFIDEINEVKGVSGKYWIYYVNGKEATVGVSKYIIKSGDIISFELK